MNGYRIMRVVLFFDLPTDSPRARKSYRTFRKFLVNEGFIMMQYSVYIRLVMNNSAAEMVVAKVRRNAPSDGDIMVLKITERQFVRMEYILGGIKDTTKILGEQRLIFLGAEND